MAVPGSRCGPARATNFLPFDLVWTGVLPHSSSRRVLVGGGGAGGGRYRGTGRPSGGCHLVSHSVSLPTARAMVRIVKIENSQLLSLLACRPTVRGGMAGQKEAVRDSVASSFTSILGPDQLSRRVAEEELKALEVTEGQVDHTPFIAVAACWHIWCVVEYGMVLTEMIAAQHTPVQYRQVRHLTTARPFIV